MAMPKPIKFTRNGVEYISNVDRTKYTLKQLVHCANKDVGKLITKETKKQIKKRSGRGRRNTQYWARRDGSLLVGYKPGGYYVGYDEIGSSGRTKKAYMTNTAIKEKNEIRLRVLRMKIKL